MMNRVVTMPRFLLAGALALLAFGLPAGAVRAQATAPIGTNTVLEDWEVVIDVPDPGSQGPQMVTAMRPLGADSPHLFVLNLNHRADPFRAGGLQTQHWDYPAATAPESPTAPQSWVDSSLTARLARAGETIRWTNKAVVTGTGQLTFGTVTAQSTTWGNWTQSNNLNISTAVPVTNLERYSVHDSVRNSGVTFQSHRVRSMALVRVQYLNGTKRLADDMTRREVKLY